MPLTDTAIRTAKSTDKPIKLTDGGGLYCRRAFKFDHLCSLNFDQV